RKPSPRFAPTRISLPRRRRGRRLEGQTEMSATSTLDRMIVTADAVELARTAADHLLAWAEEGDGPVRIALSGGSTPRRTYQELASSRLVDRFPWYKVHWYWGDERFVPPDHPDSNYRMAREAMLDSAPIPPGNIHPIPTVGFTPDGAAAAYEA